MQKIIIFRNAHAYIHDGQESRVAQGGVVLTTTAKPGMALLTIEQRLKNVVKNLRENPEWSKLSAQFPDPIKYEDLPRLPDGIFYDSGLERQTIPSPASCEYVEPGATIES